MDLTLLVDISLNTWPIFEARIYHDFYRLGTNPNIFLTFSLILYINAY